jgi:hypothetical protein
MGRRILDDFSDPNGVESSPFFSYIQMRQENMKGEITVQENSWATKEPYKKKKSLKKESSFSLSVTLGIFSILQKNVYVINW